MWVGGDSLMFLAMIPCALLWMRYEEQRATEIDRQLDLGRRGGSADGHADSAPRARTDER